MALNARIQGRRAPTGWAALPSGAAHRPSRAPACGPLRGCDHTVTWSRGDSPRVRTVTTGLRWFRAVQVCAGGGLMQQPRTLGAVRDGSCATSCKKRQVQIYYTEFGYDAGCNL